MLNERRQILAVNDVLLAELGIENPASVLGLRPGEMIDCVHAREEDGCAITKGGRGRGLGTHSMKLLGETLLRGRVDFTSGLEQGTHFRLILPA